jgi:hypothetical protein
MKSDDKDGTSLPGDPFDPSNLRLSQDFSSGVVKELNTIPVRSKPTSQEFVRVLEDENCRLTAGILEWEADGQLYIVVPNVVPHLGKDVRSRLLLPTMTATGNFFLWALKLTTEGEKINTWNISSLAAAEMAVKKWVKVSSNQSAHAYDTFVAQGNIPDPEWPKLTLKEILKLAFKDRFIDSADHPIVKKLKGISL